LVVVLPSLLAKQLTLLGLLMAALPSLLATLKPFQEAAAVPTKHLVLSAALL
jgi:hypothetical protein